MRVAFLVSDNREIERNYSAPEPYFGTAPTGLLAGFATLGAGTQDGSSVGSQNPSSKIQNSKSETPPAELAEIHVISCTQVPVQAPEKLATNVWFHSLHVPKAGWLRTGYAGCVLAIRKKLHELQPDIVHAQGTERECAISAVLSPYPRVLTIHGNLRLIRKVLRPRPWSALALQSHLEAFAVPRFDGIVCITNYTRQAIEHETPRTWVIPNAVDPDFLSLGRERVAGNELQVTSESLATRHHLRATLQKPLVLVVANVDARKNQNAFIRALDPLANSLPFRVKFFGRCGEDEYGREFQSLVAARPWCEFAGMVDRGRLRSEFAAAFALALPTHEDNCPMVVLEAQAAGLPVMASNVGGVPDLVEDQVTGLLTDPNSPSSMSLALERLLTEPDLVQTLTQNGLAQARQRFAPEVIARRHLDVYREVVGAASPIGR